MDIEEIMFRNNWKEIPIWFYFQGMLFWVTPFAIVDGLICMLFKIPFIIGFIILIPYSIFWALKGYKKYVSDRK